MKNINTILVVGAVAAVCGMAEAAVYYSTNFATSYTSGNLAGQNGWATTGTTTTNPIQITNGFAVIGTTGQDVYSAATTSASATAGTSYYLAASLTVTAAQTGDYFLHVSNPAGNTSNFYGRVFAKASGSGFVLGIAPTSTTATYGTSVLNFNQSYNVVLAIDFVAGAGNDVASIFVDPTSSDRSLLSAYASSSAWGSSVEASAIAAVNFRQGNATLAPSVKVASLAAGDSLAAIGVPAPGAAALIGLAGFITPRRRK